MWFSLIPVFLAAAVLLFVPGALVGAAAGLRASLVVAMAPAISIAIIAGTGVVAPVVGLAWGPVPIAAATALTALALLAARLWTARRRPERREAGARRRSDPVTAAAWCVAWPLSAAVTGYTVGRILNTPDAISQTYDAVFHLNAVEWILKTGNASSLRLLLEAPQGSVYPLGWHTLVAAAMRLCGATDIPLATNAMVLAVSGLVWTSGCLALTHILLRGRPLALLVAAVMAGSFSAFPILLLNWGVLYPNFLSVALLPALLAAARELVPTAGAHAGSGPTGLLLPAGALGVGGLGLTQPNTAATLLLALVILAVARAVTTVRTPPAERPAGALRRQALVSGGLAAALVLTWILMRPPRSAGELWGANYAASSSIGEAITSMPAPLWMIWVPAVLAFIGFVAALRTDGYRWLAVLHATTGALYVVARSTQDADLRFFLVGIWYNDSNRLAALLPVTAVPLAALGMLVVTQWTRALSAQLAAAQWARTLSERLSAVQWARGACERLAAAGERVRILSWWRWAACPVLVLFLVQTGPLSGAMSDSVKTLERTYMFSADSPSITPDERALIDELPDLIDKDAVVAVDPRSGAALAYALAGVDTTLKHLLHRHDPEVYVIQDKLNKAATDPTVCPAIRKLGATYALYFPGKTISNQKPFPGFTHLDTAPGFELVAKQGDAALYRITACG
mgnify:CR=1 FL=1